MRTLFSHPFRSSLFVLALSAFVVAPAWADGKAGGKPDGKDDGGRDDGGKSTGGKKTEDALKAAEAAARKLLDCLERDEKDQFDSFRKCSGSVMDKLLHLARMLADRRSQFARDHSDLISQARGAAGAEKAALVAQVRALWKSEVESVDGKIEDECRRSSTRIEEESNRDRRSEEHRNDEGRGGGGGGVEVGGGVDGKGSKPPTK